MAFNDIFGKYRNISVMSALCLFACVAIHQFALYAHANTSSAESKYQSMSNYRNGLYGWPTDLINAKGIFPFKGNTPLIAVIDTGVSDSNPFLFKGIIRNIRLGKNNSSYSALHGTMVIGIINSRGNGWSSPGGLLPFAKILSIQVGGLRGITNNELARAIVMAVKKREQNY